MLLHASLLTRYFYNAMAAFSERTVLLDYRDLSFHNVRSLIETFLHRKLSVDGEARVKHSLSLYSKSTTPQVFVKHRSDKRDTGYAGLDHAYEALHQFSMARRGQSRS